MEAISGLKTIQEIGADHAMDPLCTAHLAVRPIKVSPWKRQLLDGASELFTSGKQTKDKGEG